jgi:hypothetical protein
MAAGKKPPLKSKRGGRIMLKWILNTNTKALLDTAFCSLVEVDRCFRPALMKEAIRTSVTSVNLYETTRRNIQEGCCYYHARCLENLKSHLDF